MIQVSSKTKGVILMSVGALCAFGVVAALWYVPSVMHYWSSYFNAHWSRVYWDARLRTLRDSSFNDQWHAAGAIALSYLTIGLAAVTGGQIFNKGLEGYRAKELPQEDNGPQTSTET